MNDREIHEMQLKIDRGIQLAQERLVERSRLLHTTLVVAREGRVIEVQAEELALRR